MTKLACEPNVGFILTKRSLVQIGYKCPKIRKNTNSLKIQIYEFDAENEFAVILGKRRFGE